MLGCRRAALDARLHDARGHAGQARSAAAIRAEIARGTETEDRSRPLQEVYVLRCAPQILGACRDSLAFARQTVETEMNGVSDNPVVVADPRPEALHGGNSQGQQIAFAADTLNAAIVQTHHDMNENIACAVAGCRRCTFFPPARACFFLRVQGFKLMENVFESVAPRARFHTGAALIADDGES